MPLSRGGGVGVNAAATAPYALVKDDSRNGDGGSGGGRDVGGRRKKEERGCKEGIKKETQAVVLTTSSPSMESLFAFGLRAGSPTSPIEFSMQEQGRTPSPSRARAGQLKADRPTSPTLTGGGPKRDVDGSGGGDGSAGARGEKTGKSVVGARDVPDIRYPARYIPSRHRKETQQQKSNAKFCHFLNVACNDIDPRVFDTYVNLYLTRGRLPNPRHIPRFDEVTKDPNSLYARYAKVSLLPETEDDVGGSGRGGGAGASSMTSSYRALSPMKERAASVKRRLAVAADVNEVLKGGGGMGGGSGGKGGQNLSVYDLVAEKERRRLSYQKTLNSNGGYKNNHDSNSGGGGGGGGSSSGGDNAAATTAEEEKKGLSRGLIHHLLQPKPGRKGAVIVKEESDVVIVPSPTLIGPIASKEYLIRRRRRQVAENTTFTQHMVQERREYEQQLRLCVADANRMCDVMGINKRYSIRGLGHHMAVRLTFNQQIGGGGGGGGSSSGDGGNNSGSGDGGGRNGGGGGGERLLHNLVKSFADNDVTLTDCGESVSGGGESEIIQSTDLFLREHSRLVRQLDMWDLQRSNNQRSLLLLEDATATSPSNPQQPLQQHSPYQRHHHQQQQQQQPALYTAGKVEMVHREATQKMLIDMMSLLREKTDELTSQIELIHHKGWNRALYTTTRTPG